jgi:hypothetical protein
MTPIESRPPTQATVEEARTWRLPHTLTLLPTYKCTAACAQCCFQSNPRIKHRVAQHRLLDYIDQAAKIDSIRLVCFSGGEAFMLNDDLVELVERCASHGFLTRIVTNGYWATSDRAARRRLAPLVEAGLNEINFSTGDDHVTFVPIERVLCGLDVSLRHGLGLALMIEARAFRRVTRATVLTAAAARPELRSALASGRIGIIESPWMEFAADGNGVAQPSAALVNRGNIHLRGPCTSVLTTAVVTPSEHLGMCCGLPRETIPDLDAGDLQRHPMRELLDRAAYDFLKIWLFVEGPERVLAWAASKDPSIEWEDRYAHNCDACRAMYHDERVMRVIEQHYDEKYADILFKYALYQGGRRPVPTEG